jgi:hypothetical protein
MKQNGKTRASLFRRAKTSNLLLMPFALGFSLLSTNIASALNYNLIYEDVSKPGQVGGENGYVVNNMITTTTGLVAYNTGVLTGSNGTSAICGNYSDSAQQVPNSQIPIMLAGGYPVYNGAQLGLIYLNDGSYDDNEAYGATQQAITWGSAPSLPWEPGTPPTGHGIDTLAYAIFNNSPTLNSTWVTLDRSSATYTVNGTRAVFGPINITTDTGSSDLDTAIRAQGFTISPAAGSRTPNFTFSAQSTPNGSEASTITDGAYYINYANDDGLDTTLSVSSSLISHQTLASIEVIQAGTDAESPAASGTSNVVGCNTVDFRYPLLSIVNTTFAGAPSLRIILNPDGSEGSDGSDNGNGDGENGNGSGDIDVPNTGHISSGATIILSSIGLLASASIIASLFVVKRLKTANATKNRKIARIRL